MKPVLINTEPLQKTVSLIIDQALQQAAAHHQAGRFAEAEQLYLNILQAEPRHPDANYNLGLMALQLNKAERGLPYLQAAWEAAPSTGQYWLTLAECLLEMGCFDDAQLLIEEALRRGMESSQARQLLARAKGSPDNQTRSEDTVICEMGDMLAGRLEGNEQSANQSNAEYLHIFKKTLPVSVAAPLQPPPSPQEIDTLAALFNGKRYSEAAIFAQMMTERYPMHGFGWKVLGALFKQMGQPADALFPMQKAVALSPDDAEAHNNLGAALKELGRLDEAETSYRQALQIKPDHAEAHYNLGNTLHELGRLDEAEVSYRRALQIKPDFAGAHNNLGTSLRDLGRLGEAEASYRRALQIKPDFVEAHSNLLFMLAFLAVASPLDYLEEARKWEIQAIPQTIRNLSNLRKLSALPKAGRRLRIGYVSGDFRQHPVSCFVEPIFRLHDRNRVELFAYSASAIWDKTTDKLKELVDHWEPIAGLSDEQVRQRIEADNIDLLIDLSGHTANNRLGVFALRAAPVQAHYLGYFASTGLTEMDYWIGDSVILPKSEDAHYCESIWRLPRVWLSYMGQDNVPPSGWRATEDGTVWLGSFNNLTKITPLTVALWAKILHAMPEGRLMLKTNGLGDAVTKRRIEAAFAAYGITSARLDLVGSTPDWVSHMALYDRLDIALDPVNVLSGGTTTCDALWMGVPVITLAGQQMAQRMTASMLDAIGQSDWVAKSEDDYVNKVVAMARDIEQRRTLRFAQREKMRNSALCDGAGLARSLEDAYEAMFDKWRQERSSEATLA